MVTHVESSKALVVRPYPNVVEIRMKGDIDPPIDFCDTKIFDVLARSNDRSAVWVDASNHYATMKDLQRSMIRFGISHYEMERLFSDVFGLPGEYQW
jgi:hypothetical protein